MPTPLAFLFDYVSPYAYLASSRVRPLAARFGREVVAAPVVFGALLSAHGTRGPAEVPAKREYLFRDVLRLARALDIAIEPPATHPFSSLLALRATEAITDPVERWRFVDAMMRATWQASLRVDQPDVVARVASAAGFDGAALVAAAGSAETKARLRAVTDESVAAGVFGVPTVRAGTELFWGVEALPHLERFLRGEGAIDEAELARWRALIPSVTRKGA